MKGLQYTTVAHKHTAKLAYYLFTLDGTLPQIEVFPKKQINPGITRNNFAIVLIATDGLRWDGP
jgi:25S rRNA (adenine(2142)-N(1))-methyltransferase, Bmt2